MSKKSKSKQAPSPISNAKQARNDRRKNRNWLWIGLGLAVVFVVVGILLIPKSTSAAEISTSQAYQQYQQGSLILDVRTQAEYDEFHIENSVFIPLDELPNRVDELPRDRDIVVVCRTGNRSQQGMAILKSAGFTRVSSMSGGLVAWKAAGYPLINGGS